ncbi:MAG: polysaccharide biosynthesis tyrosine autokinase [Candidatus Acidiferrales bacterium]
MQPYSDRGEIIVHPNKSQRAPTTVLYLEPLDSGAAAPETNSLLVEMWRASRAKMHWIVLIVLLGALGGFLVSLSETPTYVAHISLEIENPTETVNLQVGGDGATIAPESYLPTQTAVLESHTLRRRAIERLKKANLPGFTPPDRFASLRSYLHLSPKPVSTAAPSQNLPSLKVTLNTPANTRIVTISIESTDPNVAAAFANALANEYIDSNLQAKWDAINNARQWLSQQLEETRTKLQTSEDQLQAYSRASNLLFTGDKDSADEDKLKQIQEALSNAEAERIEKQSAYRIATSTPADSVPQVIDNAHLAEYQRQIADLRRQLADLNSQYTPEHPKVKQVQAQIDQLEATFQKERQDVLTRIRSEYESALMREKLLTGAYKSEVQIVSDQTEKTINYSILQRDVETNRQLYDTLLQKSREADIATALRGSNTRIIDPAEAPLTPSKPNFLWNTLLGSLVGLLAAVGLVITRESLDRSFKSPGDLSFHLKLPELGVIPEGALNAAASYRKSPRLNVARPAAASTLEPTATLGAVELVTWGDKSSVMAESFRSTVTSILHSVENGASPRVILVSSAIRAEGKTTVVSNLGIALAEISQKVLLIDGDMRKPRLNEVFNLPNDWGLTDLLREKSSLRDCPLDALVKRTQMPQLSILTSGPATNSISNLLYSHRMLELLQRLRSEFDIVLIDTPPMLDISDARILGRLADAAILVFRAGVTSREAAMAAKRRLIDDGIPVLGTILNAWDVKNMGGYGYSPNEYYSPTT